MQFMFGANINNCCLKHLAGLTEIKLWGFVKYTPRGRGLRYKNNLHLPLMKVTGDYY